METAKKTKPLIIAGCQIPDSIAKCNAYQRGLVYGYNAALNDFDKNAEGRQAISLGHIKGLTD